MADLVGAVYQAACDESLWPQALQRLCAACRADSAAVVLTHARSRDRIVLAHGIAETVLLDYEAGKRPWAVFPAEEYAGEPIKPWLTAPLRLEAAECATLIVHASKPDRALREEQRNLLGVLAPHLARALEISLRCAREAVRRAELERESDGFPLGRILLDAGGCAVLSNRSAQRVLDAGDGLFLEDGKLAARRAADDALLQQALQQARAGDLSQRVAAIHRSHGRRPYVVRVAPLPSAQVSIFAPGTPVLEVLVVDHDHAVADMAFAAACWPELSRVEQRVLECLLLGESITQCAESLCITRNTAKLHVAHIFRKTGARRQSDLLRMSLLPFVAGLPRSERSGDAP